MEKTIGIAVGVYALILWVLVMFVWHKGYKEWKANRMNRVHSHGARVLDKREPKRVGIVETSPERLVLFEFGGRQVELSVPSAVYESLRVGDEGTLQLRGKRFESFEQKSQDERADDLYRRMLKG